MKRLLCYLLMLALAVGVFAGCATGTPDTVLDTAEQDGDEAAEDGGDSAAAPATAADDDVLVWNLAVDQNSWDPPFTYTMIAMNITTNLYEGLLESTSEGVKPAQAESYTVSEDGKTYTFHLRDDIYWSDGEPVTAHDYEYSWKRVCDPSLASEYSYIMYPYLEGGTEFMEGSGSRDDIGVTAIDDRTLEVKLTSPIPYFDELAAFAVYMPVRQDIVEKYGEGWEKSPASCVTNGPYKMTEYQMGSHMMLEVNEHYRDADKIQVPKIKAIFLGEATTAMNAYEAGEIQIFENVPTDEIARLKAEDPNFSVAYKASTAHLIFNVDKFPVDNPDVRKALTLAVDRVQLVEEVLKGGEVPATGMIPPHFTYSDGGSCRQLDAGGNVTKEFYIEPFDSAANIERAKEYLAQAGYPDGEGFPELEYTISNNERNKKVAEAILEMWKTNLNIECKLNLIDPATSGDSAKRGKHVVSMGGFGADYMDPVAMLDCFMSTSVNNNCLWRWQPNPVIPEDTIMNPENKAYDDAINASMNATGKERDDLLREAESILIEEGVVGPVYYQVSTVVVDGAVVEGVERTPMGSFVFKNASFV